MLNCHHQEGIKRVKAVARCGKHLHINDLVADQRLQEDANQSHLHHVSPEVHARLVDVCLQAAGSRDTEHKF